MGIFNRKKNWTNILSGLEEPFQPIGTKLLQEAYNLSAIVNIAVDKVVSNCIRAPLKILSGDTLIESGPVYNLFENVNNHSFGTQLWKATLFYKLIRGEAIWTFESDFTGLSLPKEIYIHDPLRFQSFLDIEQNKIVLWKYQSPRGELIPLLPSELVHFLVWNPVNEFRGVNPLLAFDDILQSDYLSDKNNNHLLQNRATPSGILSTETGLTEDKANEYIERWERKHKGVNRTGSIAVLGNSLKYQAIGLTPAEMEYLALKKWNRSTIMSKFGVPSAVSGYKDNTTPLSGTDTKEQLTQFWNQTIIPHLQETQSLLKTEFANRWTPNLTLEFDISQIAELQTDLEKLSTRQINEVKTGIITINEVRAERGLEPVEWGDIPPTTSAPVAAEEVKTVTPLTLFNKDYDELLLAKEYQQTTVLLEEKTDVLTDELLEWLYNNRSKTLTSFVTIADKPTFDIKAATMSFQHIQEKHLNIMLTGQFTKQQLTDLTELTIIRSLAQELSQCKDKEAIKSVYNSYKHQLKDYAEQFIYTLYKKNYIMELINKNISTYRYNNPFELDIQHGQLYSTLFVPSNDRRWLPF